MTIRSSRAGFAGGVGVAAALEQVESLAEPVEDLRGGEDTRAGGGELDRERQLVEPAAELGDRLVRLEARALAEELDRLRLRERRHRVVDLALIRSSSRLVTRSLRLGRPRAAARAGRRLDHLLEVVEQQQELALADVLGEAVLRPERLRDRLRHERGVAQRGQADPEDARLECGHELGGGLDGEAGLARAAGAGEGDQARAVAKQRE